jgi:hypothetical protein
MKIISHRGNINGPVVEKENRPSYIDCAIQLGYDVEVDLRLINNEFWLGHDEAQYRIELSWMELRKDKIWYHCKDIYSALKLAKLDNEYQYFCHSIESFVCTSNGYIWVHDLENKIDDKCIIPLISKEDIQQYNGYKPFAVCTDFVNYFLEKKSFLFN